jgi:hypothetical protein
MEGFSDVEDIMSLCKQYKTHHLVGGCLLNSNPNKIVVALIIGLVNKLT